MQDKFIKQINMTTRKGLKGSNMVRGMNKLTKLTIHMTLYFGLKRLKKENEITLQRNWAYLVHSILLTMFDENKWNNTSKETAYALFSVFHRQRCLNLQKTVHPLVTCMIIDDRSKHLSLISISTASHTSIFREKKIDWKSMIYTNLRLSVHKQVMKGCSLQPTDNQYITENVAGDNYLCKQCLLSCDHCQPNAIWTSVPYIP